MSGGPDAQCGAGRPGHGVREFAPAKVNLTLHVTGRRADGYHLLDSLVVFADAGDSVLAAPADELSLEITGPHAQPLHQEPIDSNLVLRAAQALRAWAAEHGLPSQGAALILEKHLPVASGIGGGSADAAAALRALVRLWALNIPRADLMDIALGLGADVPVCLHCRAAIMRGIGDEIMPAPPLPQFWLVLANPRVAVPTAAVFEALDLKAVSALGVPHLSNSRTGPEEAAAMLRTCRNDLEVPAQTLAPEVAQVIDALDGTKGVLLARMSGSGATCFALFPDERSARAAARRLGAEHSDWWVTAAKMMR